MTRFSPGFIFPNAPGAALALTYHGQWANTTDSGVTDPTASYTFSQATHGVNTSDPYVYIGVSLQNAFQFSRITVGGSNANTITQVGTSRGVGFVSWAHGGGNLGQIQVFKSQVGTANRCGIAIWSANNGGLGGSGPLAAEDTDIADTTDPFQATLTVTAGGIILALGGTSSNPGVVTGTNIAQDFGDVMEGSNAYFGMSGEQASGGAIAITADTANAPGSSNFCAVSFPPV